MKKLTNSYVIVAESLVTVICLVVLIWNSRLSNPILLLLVLVSGIAAGLAIVGFFYNRCFRNPEERARQLKIAQKDERNILIREKAGLTMWAVSGFLLVILVLAFTVFHDDRAAYLTLGVLLVHFAGFCTFIFIYDKKL